MRTELAVKLQSHVRSDLSGCRDPFRTLVHESIGTRNGLSSVWEIDQEGIFLRFAFKFDPDVTDSGIGSEDVFISSRMRYFVSRKPVVELRVCTGVPRDMPVGTLFEFGGVDRVAMMKKRCLDPKKTKKKRRSGAGCSVRGGDWVESQFALCDATFTACKWLSHLASQDWSVAKPKQTQPNWDLSPGSATPGYVQAGYGSRLSQE
ncbi:hypothetical protein EDB84DRAFT_1447058 [Lactarius hengduanensis]|nr:hypothetical protein EDB84DRAFT_1447058 [Lactarius hengduanensis]